MFGLQQPGHGQAACFSIPLGLPITQPSNRCCLRCAPHAPPPQRYDMLKQEAVQAERHMLRAFGFVVHVEHPHRFILNYCQMVLFDTVKHPER